MKVMLARLLHACLKHWPEWVVAFGLGLLLGLAVAVKSNERLVREGEARAKAECAAMYLAPLTVTVTKTPPSVAPPPSRRGKP